MTSTLDLFFMGHKIISTIPVTNPHVNDNHILQPNPFIYNYSTLSSYFTSQTNVTPCYIAACESIGNTPTNKVYCVLFDSGSSKILVHKCIILWNFTPIQSLDDLQIFSLAGATMSTALIPLTKIRFPQFDHTMIVDKHPALFC